LALTFVSLRKERERRTQLEDAEETLQAQLEVILENEQRLAALNQTSTILSQSLELKEVLDKAVENVIEVMQVEAAWILLMDKEAGELSIAAYQGISNEFVKSADKIKMGQGFNGRVAETGEPMFVENASEDPRLTRKAWKNEGIHSLLIVPLKSKGIVVGTLCAIMRSYRQFDQDEVELLTAIGNQIGVAVENARLYEQQRETSEQLRASEERYRELFERAHDAIMLHDLKGNLITANRATVGLTGYSLEELPKLRGTQLVSKEDLRAVGQAIQSLLEGKTTGSVSEAKLVRKDGTEVFVQLSTSLVMSNGQPIAFQHIARDITEEKRMRENLRFYLEEVTKAQEEERKRIARELHDDTVQSLIVLSRQLDDLTSDRAMVSEEARLRLENLWQQTNNAINNVRRLSQDLRPPTLDRLGLLPALNWLASNVEEYSGIAVKVQLLGIERRLPEEVELLLFRITQEALRNVWRHSQATEAAVIVEFSERELRITIKDNGRGFDIPDSIGDLARTGKLGLVGMQERAKLLGGDISIESKPGEGTTLTIRVPT
jgi:PAS domain S-box-containing protein